MEPVIKTAKWQRLLAIGQAILVTLLWASSYVLIKMGLVNLPPLTFGSLRYLLAFGGLFIWRLFDRARNSLGISEFDPAQWRALIALGLILYTMVPAAMFVSLSLLPAVSVNFVFQAGIPIVTAISGGLWLGERTSWIQWLGVLVIVGGIYLFFPAQLGGVKVAGIILAGSASVGVGLSNLLTRYLMRAPKVRALDVSLVSMGIGSFVLLCIGLLIERFPRFDSQSALILTWLGLVNTAAAFTLWNHTLRTLSALEAGVLANAQIIEVIVLAALFLNEPFTTAEIVSSFVIITGIILVYNHSALLQWWRHRTQSVISE